MIATALAAALLLQAEPAAAPPPTRTAGSSAAPSAYQRREGKATHLPGASTGEAAAAADARTAGATAPPAAQTSGASTQASPTGRPHKPSAYQRREGKAGHLPGAPRADEAAPPAPQK